MRETRHLADRGRDSGVPRPRARGSRAQVRVGGDAGPPTADVIPALAAASRDAQSQGLRGRVSRAAAQGRKPWTQERHSRQVRR